MFCSGRGGRHTFYKSTNQVIFLKFLLLVKPDFACSQKKAYLGEINTYVRFTITIFLNEVSQQFILMTLIPFKISEVMLVLSSLISANFVLIIKTCVLGILKKVNTDRMNITNNNDSIQIMNLKQSSCERIFLPVFDH